MLWRGEDGNVRRGNSSRALKRPRHAIEPTPPSDSPRADDFDGAHIAASTPRSGVLPRSAAGGAPALHSHAQAMSSTPHRPQVNGFPRQPNGINGSAVRRAQSLTRDAAYAFSHGAASVAAEEEEEERAEDPTHLLLKSRWAGSEAHIAALFDNNAQPKRAPQRPITAVPAETGAAESAKTSAPPPPPPSKKPARQIDDDYGDDDDEEDEEEVEKESPLKSKGKAAVPHGWSPHAVRSPAPAVKPPPLRHAASISSSSLAKSSEDVRKQLEQEKKDAAENAKRNFQSMFSTLEYDRGAMLEQQKLDELDREVDNEISSGPTMATSVPAASSGAPATQGTLGSADLGASSLTLKHLIARIDMKRTMVKASDDKLRTLISEVRKGRSKWASEDRVGQEELYEAAEKVLMELKAMTEYVQPFLQRVSKREAPDYFTVIKRPMDIGTMLKKLKQLSYKSKSDFVDDLKLIWNNCLLYNGDANHPLRKKALHMSRETDKLVPLIPEISVRDRAEVEAEERRLHSVDAEDSDDDDAPIMASRGRKAPKKGAKGAPSSARKGPPAAVNGTSTPAPEGKPNMHHSNSHLRNDFLRGDSEAHDVGSLGFSTPPPPGFATPYVNGVHSNAHGSQADLTEVDGLGNSVMSVHIEDADEEDAEFKTWKQVTMKDRAMAAAERNRLFRGERLNPEEPALLRNKVMMRRWVRQQRNTTSSKPCADDDAQNGAAISEPTAAGGVTLAEGIEKDEDSTLPDYYNPVSAIPDINEAWRWTTDADGSAMPQSDKYMRMYPREEFTSREGGLNARLEANMRQMQDTRKVCAKIGVVKQMQIQSRTYQNQFPKYESAPFHEQDIGAVVVSESGPPMAPWVHRAALQRSIGKIFYHAGFEDFQPSALDIATDVATQFMAKMAETLKLYHEQPLQTAGTPRFTFEEEVLHTLDGNGVDIESLENYAKEDVERLSTKLGVVHDRMKAHLADLLRPALSEHAGQDGVGAFDDGSEQFVGGDFAEDLEEDYFGFRELGLAEEFGLESLSVPLHLLQNRMRSAYQSQHAGPVIAAGNIFPPLEPYEPITRDTVGNQVGLVQGFFSERVRANRDQALVEDEDLPIKQRFPKPRLPPTGKISSPRKRPLREQQQMAKKKRKLDEEAKSNLGRPPVGKLKLQMPETDGVGDPEKEREREGEVNGPISPESIVAGT